jgi:hypothetical protein
VLLICSIIGGVVVIAGLYMLLWGKDKDQEYNGSSEEKVPEMDCERQQAKIIGASTAKTTR